MKKTLLSLLCMPVLALGLMVSTPTPAEAQSADADTCTQLAYSADGASDIGEAIDKMDAFTALGCDPDILAAVIDPDMTRAETCEEFMFFAALMVMTGVEIPEDFDRASDLSEEQQLLLLIASALVALQCDG